MLSRFLKALLAVLIVMAMIVVAANWVKADSLTRDRFNSGTVINGTDCSLMTVEEANSMFAANRGLNREVTFTTLVADGSVVSKLDYAVKLQEFDVEEQRLAALEKIYNEQQQAKNKYDFFVAGPKLIIETLKKEPFERFEYNEYLYGIDREKLVDYIGKLPGFLESNKKLETTDAYIVLEGNHLKIVPEIVGNDIDFEQAVNYALKCLEEENFNIDFSNLVEQPKITKDNEVLVENVNSINKYLSKVITFQLIDGTEVTLDSSITKDWLVQDENGLFSFEFDDNIDAFVDKIEQMANSIITNSMSLAIGDTYRTVTIPNNLRPKLNREKLLQTIRELFFDKDKNEDLYIVAPEYDENTILNTYIALSIEKQTVWAYDNGVLILEADCVTGDVARGHSTPTGIYYLTYKTKDATLRGINDAGYEYASFVSFWMPFNGGIGFHDASWRNGNFGGDLYKTDGSLGCVNMRHDDAEVLYNFINSEIPIFVLD